MRLSSGKFINFETGSKKDAYDKYGNPSPYFRKKFILQEIPQKAVLRITCIGLFKAYINGKEVSDDCLSPGWSDYRIRIPCMEYDITELLDIKNAIGVVCGDGWAVGKVGNRMLRCNYYDKIELFAAIELKYKNGHTEYIYSDETWLAYEGEIRRNDIYMGEYVDRRYYQGDFSLYDFNDNNWNKVKTSVDKIPLIDKAISPPVKVKDILYPVVKYKDKDRTVYDFMQNFAGLIRVSLRGEEGAKVVCRYAEILEGDNLYTENLRTAEAADTYILSDEKEQVFCPLFTFHGFRYAEINIYGNVEIISTEGLVIYSDLESTADFQCSDEIINRIYNNIVWSQRSNFIDVPLDCPQRNERLGWTGDIQVFCGTAMFNMDCRSFFKKYLTDVRDAQCGNGGITGVAPIVPAADYLYYRGRIGAAGWADVIAVLPYEYYLMYGDISIIKENLQSCKRHIDFCLNDSDNYIRNGASSYGDWLSVGEETDKEVLATMYFAYSALLTGKMCEILKDDDKEYYYDLFLKIKEAFTKKFVDQNGIIKSDTQTVYLLAYAFGLRNTEEVKTHISRTLSRSDGRLTTGFLGVKYLLPVLCEIGLVDEAYSLISSTRYPSWGYSVINGATTIWERWNSYTKENGFADSGMNSFNHYAFGSCGEWIFKYCLGIYPVIKDNIGGFCNIKIRPFISENTDILFVKGYYDSVKGKITVEWEKNGKDIIYKVNIPQDIYVEFDFKCFKDANKVSENVYLLKL